MQRRAFSIVVAAVVVLVSIAAGFGKGAQDVLFVGEGTRIDLKGDGAVYTISSNEPTWIRHGFGAIERYPGINSEYVHQYGDVTNGGLYFDLWINGRKANMVPERDTTPLGTPGHILCEGVLWHVQFPAGYFAPGTYEITGEWGCRNPKSGNSSDVGYPMQHTVWLVVGP